MFSAVVTGIGPGKGIAELKTVAAELNPAVAGL